MSQRLPTPGGDNGDWGDILNDFLEVSHNSDGTLANNIVGTNQLQTGSVTATQLGSQSVGTDQLQDNSVTNAQLDSPTQSAITKADSAVQQVNGKAGPTVTLAASDVSAIPSSQLGVASGIAQLDSNSTLEASQLPISVVTGDSSGPATWTATTDYVVNQLVINSGTVYICNTSHISASSWSADASNWTSLGSAGDVPNGGTTGQALTKNSDTSGDTGWQSVAIIDHVDAPIAETQDGSAGTSSQAAAADHSHPLSQLGRNMMFGGFPPAYNFDVTLDGSGTVSNPSNYGFLTTAGGTLLTLSGSTYTNDGWGNNGFKDFLYCRNFVLNSGITLKPRLTSGGMVIIASESITINGTVVVDGASASGATGGTGETSGSISPYQGYLGANGGTGAGSVGAGSAANGFQPGSSGGSGGASGATAAGGGGGGPSGQIWPSGQGLLLLEGSYYPQNSPTLGTGGGGGGSGAGDGTNAGGGGGAGGGIMILVAPSITIGSTGVLSANGGNGAAGVGGNAGGGGGGGNGVIALHSLDLSINASAIIRTNGGTGGAGSGTGNSGTTPTTGGYFADPPVINGGYGYGKGILICQWQ